MSEPELNDIWASEVVRLRDERDRLRGALERISTEHCTYKTDCNSPYDIGVVDGHRCAATIARAALTPARGDEMRDFNRIMPMLERIEAIWKRNPDLRLMQLLGNVTGAGDPYYVEDDVLLEGLKRVYQHDQEPR